MHICVVKNFRPQFCFLATATVKKAVINDENITSLLAADIVIYDICCEKGSKTRPVCNEAEKSAKHLFLSAHYIWREAFQHDVWKEISEHSQLRLSHLNSFVVYWTWHKSPL